MKKILLPVILILAILVSTSAFAANTANGATPTPPPPPKATATNLPKPTNPPAKPKKTKKPTPTQGSSGPWISRTPMLSPTSAETMTLIPTATITPTATPIPTYLKIQVYMDVNENRQFDVGEGVDDLIVTTTTEGGWQSWAATQAGKVTFLLPPNMAKGTAIDVEVSYLHWSLVIKAPDTGGTARGELQLALPEYPGFLP